MSKNMFTFFLQKWPLPFVQVNSKSLGVMPSQRIISMWNMKAQFSRQGMETILTLFFTKVTIVTLTFDLKNPKSIGVLSSLRAKMVGNHWVYRRTDWWTDGRMDERIDRPTLAKQYALSFWTWIYLTICPLDSKYLYLIDEHGLTGT